MAIVELPLKYGLDDGDGSQIIKQADLDNQSRLEVIQCWDIMQVWQDWFTEKFGALKRVRHRSGTDDPPDLELLFTDCVVGMEHTRLQPEHLGHAEALSREWGQGGFIPSISSPPADFEELRDVITGVGQVWSNVFDEWKAISVLLAITLKRKMRGMPNGGIIGIVHDLIVHLPNQKSLAEIGSSIINRREFADFTGYTLILLDRVNAFKFYSFLLRRGEDIFERIQ